MTVISVTRISESSNNSCLRPVFHGGAFLLSLVEQYGGIEPLVEALESVVTKPASPKPTVTKPSYTVKPHSASQVNQSYASQYQSKPAVTKPSVTTPAKTPTQVANKTAQVAQQPSAKPAAKPFGWNRYSNDAVGRAQEQWDQDEQETGIHHSPRPEAKPVSAPTFKPNAIQGAKATATGNVNLNQTTQTGTQVKQQGAPKASATQASSPKASAPKLANRMKAPVRKPVVRKPVGKKPTPKQIRQNIASSNKQVGQSMVGGDYSASMNPFAQTDYASQKYGSSNTKSKPSTYDTWKKKYYGKEKLGQPGGYSGDYGY